MIENIVTCDRCRKKCEGTTYYTVEIYGHDIRPSNDGTQSMTTATQNAQTNTYKLFNHEKHYCEKCRDKIIDFLSNTNADAFVEPNIQLNNDPDLIREYPSYLNRPKKNEITMCKDCDVPHNKWLGCPKLNGLIPPPNFGCAFGEPKTSK